MASMNQTEGVLCISTKWDETTQQVIGNFRQTIPKQTPDEPSNVYCTVLDVELSQEQKEDAARHGVTLIPATRPKWSDAAEDPPAISWLFSHVNYYPNLQTLEHITHVVALSAKTKTVASAIHDNLFPQAKLDLVNSKPAALFVGNSWNKDELGLTGFHRTLIKDFCKRKAEVGEDLKAYSTVLDVKISDDQKKDAESCGVTLIEAQRREGIKPQHDPPRPDWLLLPESYYPNLGEIENVHYVVGYAPKTGLAAAYIREKLFPGAKLVLINHACPESNCLQVEEYREYKFEEKMLQMARKADLLFSIGPGIYEYFLTAYKGHIYGNGKELSEIPHEEILPLPSRCSLGKEPGEGEIRQHQILTCGQMDTKQAVDRCNIMAASIGNAANRWKATHTTAPKWKIQGVSKQAGEIEVKFLIGKMKCPHIQPILYPGHSAKSLLTSLQQSHLCLPSSCYTDYSFYGLEAMVSGLPTAVDESSHLGCFINKYLKEHAVKCVLPAQARKKDLSAAILKYLNNTDVAFKHAKDLATDLFNSEAMAKRYAIFTTLLTSTVMQQTGDEVGRDMTDTDLSVQIELDAIDSHHQHLRETEEDVTALLGKGSKEPEQKVVNQLKAKLTHRVEEVVADEDRREEVMKICNRILEDMVPELLTVRSLAILLRFLTLYNLYKLKQTCRSGSLARAFEPLLITDEMRKIAAEAGIKLQLKATYDTKKFEEVEVFFINRDGGGIQPVKFYDNIIEEENDENLTFDRHDTVVTEDGKLQLKSNVTESGQTDSHQKDQGKRKDPSKLLLLELDAEREIKSSTETNVCSLFKAEKCIRWTGRQFDMLQAVMTMTDRVEHILSSRQEILALLGVTRYLLADSEGLSFLELEEQLIQHGEPTQPITAVYETLSLQARSLLLHKPSKKKLTDSEIRYLELAQSKVHSLQSQLDKAFTEKKLLETQLAEAVQEKSQQERQYQKYMYRCHTAEKVVSTQLSDVHKFKDRVEKLEIKLKKKDTIITELRTRLSQLSDAQYDIELQKKIAKSLQLGGHVSTEMKEKGAAN
ncbi:uncharacterized protein [Ptychodera flava]|uniref:uncharacterized protein n=1 Tax=Ptychodera flava TaxID=63121 RepID=UPI00396A8565